MRREMQMSFYQQVKMINFIRRLVHIEKNLCHTQQPDIVKHVLDTVKSSTQWNQPQ